MTFLRHSLSLLFLAFPVILYGTDGWDTEPAPSWGDPVNIVHTGLSFGETYNEPTEGPLAGFAAVTTVGNIADEITPEIQNLAQGLQNDPMRIFEFVYNAIEYEHYYGSKKGAHLTLLEGSGNDMDQSSLLVALLRAAGHTAKYVREWNIVPYDETASYYPGVPPPTGVSWLRLDPVPLPGMIVSPGDKPNTSWTDDEFRKSFLLFSYFVQAGYDAFIFSQLKGGVIVSRTLVETTVGGSPRLFDPSAKPSQSTSRVDLISAIGFNKTQFLNEIGGTTSGNYVTGISAPTVSNKVSTYTSALATHLRANRPNGSVADVLGLPEVTPRSFPTSQHYAPFLKLTNPENAPIKDTVIPLSEMSSLSIQINTGGIYTIKMPELQGRRLAVTAVGNTVNVWLGDTATPVHSAQVSAATYQLTMFAKHPHYSWVDGVTPLHDRESPGTYKKSGAYALIYAFSPSRRFLQSRQRALDEYIAEVKVAYPTLVGPDGDIDLGNFPQTSPSDIELKRKVTTESLNVMGLNWLYQTKYVSSVVESITNVNAPMFHMFGRMGQEEGYFVDVGLLYAFSFPRNGTGEYLSKFGLTWSYLSSGLEHGIIDQYAGESGSGVSTIKIMHQANVSTLSERNRIYMAHSGNWLGTGGVKSQLLGYTDTFKSLLETSINAGNTLILPRNADNSQSSWSWSGTAYVEIRPSGFGMKIGGDYDGGWNVTNAFVNPAPIFQNYASAPNFYSTGSVSNVINRTTPAFNVPSFFGADPVDMATGAFVYDKEDLSLGGQGVRGLSFQRHYNSNRSNSDASKLGYGWTHSYEMNAVIRTAAEAGLGETTPFEAAPIFAAAAMISELVNDTSNLKAMVAGMLVANTAVDNLFNNAVALQMGGESVQFIKYPNGTYIAPAGSTMTLTKSGDNYLAKERFGNTYKFDITDDGRIYEIEDFFGKKLTFAYNANGLHTVTDAYSRSLTFGYTSGRISSVTDSTNRSVGFGYTNGTLTTATDPESKTWTFGYDTERRLDELIDPENRTVVVNRYDSEGRVYEQDSEGDSTKTWKMSFTGLRNTETNPLGGEKIYFYDKRGRPTGVQDALGNRVRMVYDGQDHMVERYTAKNELYKQTFNADHNLTEAENPIGVKTIYRYDSLKRVDQITVRDTDAATADRVTGIEYTSGNISNLPNKITAPKSNVSRKTYYSDGNLWTSVEESTTGNRTTTFYYDARGMPQTTTYHDNISEGFVYTVRGDLQSQTDRRNNTTSFLYNNRRQPTDTTQPGNRVTERRYDDSGNLQTVTDAEDNITRFTYSATGKLLTETIADGTDHAETTTHYYDERDWKDYTLDPRNQKTDFGYDAAGRITSVINPLLHVTILDYDANGNRTYVKTPLGHETETTYTPLGAEDTMTDAADNVVDYGYNAYGERNTLLNRRNNTFEFFYDANGNPTITETPLDHTLTKSWNDRNLVGSIEEASGQMFTFVHDHLRRIYTQTDAVGTITFGYDNNGNPETVTEGTAVLDRDWDELNRPESYTNARNETIGYQYYDNGLLWKLTYPGNREVTYTYYPTNRLETVTDWANRTTTYFWDDAGRLDRIERPNNVDRTHVYDNANRLERIYERNEQGRLLVYFKFGYDDDGRLTSRYRLPQPRPFALPAATATHDDDNRIETWNGLNLVHDDDGNMTTGPLGAAGLVTYGYDARNRLTSVGSVAAGFTTYAYDAENNRVSRTDTTGATRYLVDPHGDALPRILVRERPDNSTTSYVYGIGLLYEVDDATGDATYYHYDNIGSTVALTGPTGAQTDRIEYDPYGTVTFRTGTNDTPFLYVGQLGVQQEANGLHYMRARYYSTELRRFLNADPIGFAGGLNWYAYAGGNPVMLVDPSGNGPQPTSVAGTWLREGKSGSSIYTNLGSTNTMSSSVNFLAPSVSAMGLPILGKGSLLGSNPYTSVLSTITQELPDVRIKTSIPTPTPFNLGASTSSLTRAGARYLPVAGYAVMGVEVYAAEDRARAVFSAAGQFFGGAVGAPVGLVGGTMTGNPVGVVAGPIIGGIGGAKAGGDYMENFYDDAIGPPMPKE